MSNAIKEKTTPELIEKCRILEDAANACLSIGNEGQSNEIKAQIKEIEQEIYLRGRQESPKQEAKPQTAPSSQAITKQAVQVKPKEVVPVMPVKSENVKQSQQQPKETKEKIQLSGIYKEKVHFFENANLRRKHQKLERKLQTSIKQWNGLKHKEKRKEKYRLLIKKRLDMLTKFIDEFAVPEQKKYLLNRKISSWIKGGEDIPLNENLFKIIGF